jgi:hypothetical protein
LYLWAGRLLALVAIMLPHVPFCVILSATAPAQVKAETSGKKKCCCCCCGGESESPPINQDGKSPSQDCPAKIPCHYCASFSFIAPQYFLLALSDALISEPVVLLAMVRFVDGFPEGVERPPRQMS